VCDACQQAKSHQLPYPKSSSVSSHPLELIFSDIWGPAPSSVGNYKYYVSFIDDFSKITWIYLLKFKSEVFQKFNEFQTLVERLFNRKIITVQTDWGGEYEKLNSFFRKTGISHHVSCRHAHQQNGSAECKHRHIVEVGLSLLAQASMPLKFWDEAFLAATFLINRIPSKVIANSTPLERLFQIHPEYTSLRIFGCACWPNLRPYNRHKLQFRSKECVFLGYSNLHKGFKCLDISTGRIYISRDVVFYENIFPFTKLHPNAGARLRSEILLLPSTLLSSDPMTSGDKHAADPLTNVPAANSIPAESNWSQDRGTADSRTPVHKPVLETSSRCTPTSPSQWNDNTHPLAPSPVVAQGGTPATAKQVVDSSSSLLHAPATAGERATDSDLSLSGHTTDSDNSLLPGSGSTPALDSSASTDDHAAWGGPVLAPFGSAAASEPVAISSRRPHTRLQAGVRRPKVYSDGTVRYGLFTSSGEPQCLEEALEDHNWKNAMNAEYEALIKHKTWHLV
jgi:hypothetical protein